MRGADEQSGSMFSMFSYVSLEARIPPDHPLRAIRRITNRALARLSPHFDAIYVRFGPPVDSPEQPKPDPTIRRQSPAASLQPTAYGPRPAAYLAPPASSLRLPPDPRPSRPSSQPPACVVLTVDTTLTHAAVDSRHNRAKG